MYFSNQNKVFLIIVHLFIVIFITGCVPTTTPCSSSNPPTKSTATPTLGTWTGNQFTVQYGNDAMQNIDIYLPTVRNSSTKVFVFIPGGAWRTGTNTKTEMVKYIDFLKSRFTDAAFYNIEYKLHVLNTNINQFPTQENDVKQAVDYILNRASLDNVSQKLILVGISAGAHLSLLESYKHNLSGNIKAVAVFAPPVDMMDLKTKNFNGSIASLLNSVTGNNDSLLAQSSPINFISAQSPPTITLQGDSDYEIDYNQSVLLCNDLSTNSVIYSLQTFSCENHVFKIENIEAGCNLITSFVNSNVH